MVGVGIFVWSMKKGIKGWKSPNEEKGIFIARPHRAG